MLCCTCCLTSWTADVQAHAMQSCACKPHTEHVSGWVSGTARHKRAACMCMPWPAMQARIGVQARTCSLMVGMSSGKLSDTSTVMVNSTASKVSWKLADLNPSHRPIQQRGGTNGHTHRLLIRHMQYLCARQIFTSWRASAAGLVPTTCLHDLKCMSILIHTGLCHKSLSSLHEGEAEQGDNSWLAPCLGKPGIQNSHAKHAS